MTSIKETGKKISKQFTLHSFLMSSELGLLQQN